ncbi:ABC transporter permease [Campylobacter sp. FOBRC14]|uniref:ABC transporter permease n=1 Tax=Campylobacter sp. FOBRC14 TaxID=936554 RepID=UPI00027A389E|nr:ABC transporter permease [Campylobacter sp. FOBRC14]EJP76153.1 ABC transporter, permease protein [Campylobacter sp. FOBRC14]
MRYVYQILVLAAVLALWQGFSGDLLPSPEDALTALLELIKRGNLATGIAASISRYVVGLVLGCIFAVMVGLVFGLFPSVASAFEPLIGLLRPISPIAWIPFALLAFGIGDKPTIFIISYAVFFPMLLLTTNAVKSTPAELMQAARGFGASRLQTIIGVILPSSLFGIISGLKLAASLAWINLVVGEMVGAQSGLGYLIIDARNQLRIDMVLAVIFVIGVIGTWINFIFSLVERWAAARLGR